MKNPLTRLTAGSALALLAILLTCSCAAGDSQAVGPDKPVKTGKVDHALIELHDQFSQYKEAGGDSEHFEVTNPQVRIVNDSVLVDAVATEGTVALQNDLRRLGATHLSSYGRIVSCYLPIASIEQLADIDSLQFVRAARPTTHPSRN